MPIEQLLELGVQVEISGFDILGKGDVGDIESGSQHGYILSFGLRSLRFAEALPRKSTGRAV